MRVIVVITRDGVRISAPGQGGVLDPNRSNELIFLKWILKRDRLGPRDTR
jgi:hypothetical protein